MNSKHLLFLLVLIALVACGQAPNPTQTAAPEQPTNTPSATQGAPTTVPVTSAPTTTAPTSAPTVVPPTAGPTATPVKPNDTFGQGLTNEPLAIVSTQPAKEGKDAPVTRDTTRIVVQFNHPVVPLVSVDAQKDLPQPLSFSPAVSGSGQWINTSTYSFAPSQDLKVATAYTVTVGALKDMLGQALTSYAWSFTTVSPAIVKTDPATNSKFFGATQPLTVTFNTEMDRQGTESRWTVRRTDTGVAAAGTFQWNGTAARWIPSKPLDYDAPYSASLAPGAPDVNKVAVTAKEFATIFRTAPAPAVLSTNPKDGDKDSKAVRDSFLITFASPMARDTITVTVQPTITNMSIFMEYGKDDTVARVSGSWLASQAYTVTVRGTSQSRDGEPLGKDTVVRFTAAPLDPSVTLNTPGMLGMYDVNGPQVIYATATNVKSVDYKLYSVDRTDVIRLGGRDRFQVWGKYVPSQANLLRTWSLPVSAPLNASQLVSTTLVTGQGARLAPGVYFVSATAPNNQAQLSRHVLIVTAVNVALKRTETEALAWVTDLKTGKPVGGQPLSLFDQAGKQIAAGQTDTDGILRVKYERQNSYDPLTLLSESDGKIVAAVGSDWNSGINTYDFNLPTQYTQQDYYANLYTDRSIYRPGQTVYYKGILRQDNDASYQLPQGLEQVPVKVRDDRGREISSQNVTLSKFGTFNGEIKLTDNASIGFYNVGIELGTDPRKFFQSVGFQVAEYKAPEYQVDVQSDKPAYINGETVKVDVNSTYFFGGPVNNAKATWRLLSSDLSFHPDTVKGYWDFIDSDLLTDRQRQADVPREGKGTTDAQGKFHFEVPADLKDYPLSQTFTLEAEITDINNQSVSSRTSADVHKGLYYIGLRPQRYLGTVGQEQAVDVITVDTKGLTVTNQALSVSIYERQWYSVRAKYENGEFYWKSAFTDTLSSKLDVTTNAQGAATARFTPSKGGIYRILAEGKDSRGNAIRSATYLWVSTTSFVNWRIENNDRVELVTDKKEYAPGETAELLIPAPFSDAEALLTIERGTIREVKRITLKGNSERVQIPITADYAPNVFISVMLVKGRTADSPAPQFKLGYTNIQVSTLEKQLKVTLTPDKTGADHYGPGDKATFALSATDFKGQPAQAEFSVALVDKAILSLVDDMSESPLNAFYGQRGIAVNTSASLVRSVERLNQTLQPEAKGGGGGPAQAAPVRSNIRDTAFWSGSVTTDASGKATVTIPLPDNLTTWNMAVKGVTVDTKVGESRAEILSTKDLLVRPVTPRFVVVGDKARLEAVVNNNTDKDITTDVRLDAQGLTVNGNATKPLTVKARDKAKVTWETTVNPVEQVTVRFTVTGGGLQDAFEQPLSVVRPTAPETVATAGQVDTKIAEQIVIPSGADKAAGQLKIDLSPSLAAASTQSFNYLQDLNYYSTEATVSRFFPNVATYRALRKLGTERTNLRLALEANISNSVQRLYALQNQDGGWGWWGADDSIPTLTAYTLYGLWTAKDAGFAIDLDVMNRAEQFLVKYLDKPVDVKQTYQHNERAFTLFVLTEMGRNNYASRAVALYEQRANLELYGKAYLLMALLKTGPAQAVSLKTELLNATLASATGAHWEEKTPDYKTLNTNTRTTAIVLMALSRAEPKNPTAANAVRWLMTSRKVGMWPTTQETAWAILGLTEYMIGTGELNASYSYQVTLNGKALDSGKVDATNIDQPKELTVAMKDLVQSAANELAFTRDGATGRLYYSAFLQYYLPTDKIPALNRGIIVGRQYYAVDGQTLKPTDRAIGQAKIGDYVQVRLTIIAPNDLNYVTVEDPLPAGFEAVDTTLKTSSAAAQVGKLEQKSPENDPNNPFFRPYWAYWAHTEIRDDKIALFASFLGKGTYEYSYIMRASLAGEFRTLPANAYETYFPDVFGRSTGATFLVTGE